MTALVAAEWLKLRSTRAPYGLVLGMLALVGLIVGVTAAAAPDDVLFATDWSEGVAGAASDGATIFALILGILLMGWEFRHATITPTLLATPSRVKVVVAKLVVGAFAGVVLAVIAGVLAVALALPILRARGATLEVDGELGVHLLGLLGADALWGALGVALAAALRNQVVAIVLSLAWVLLLEATIAFFLPDVGKYFPGQAVQALTSPGGSNPDEVLLSAAAGGAVAVAYVAAFAALGTFLLMRRDVS